jgi:hypothetical protein
MNVLAGSTDVTTYFALRLAADGTDATGLTITNIDLQYTRSGDAPAAKVDATALAATNSAHGDNQAIELDATDPPGLYRVDWPDAAFASGVREVVLTVKCATAFTEHLRVNLTPVPANAVQVSGDATAADTLELFAEALDQSTGQLDSGTFAAGAITAAAIANGAIDAATFAADVDAEILSYLVDDATRIDASALNTLSSHDPGEAIMGATDTVAANVTQLNGSTAGVAGLARACKTIVVGTADAGSTTTAVVAKSLTPASTEADQFNGLILKFPSDTTTAALRGQGTDITDFNHATQTFTVTALTEAPAEDDVFVIE